MVLGEKFGGFVQKGTNGNRRPIKEQIESRDVLIAITLLEVKMHEKQQGASIC